MSDALPTNVIVDGWRYWTQTELMRYEFAGKVSYYDGMTTCMRQRMTEPHTIEELAPDEYMRLVRGG